MATIRIGDLLKAKGLANDQQINIAFAQQKITGELLGDVIVKLGFVTAMELAQALSEQVGIDFVDLNEYPISEDALRKVPKSLAENAGFIPIDFTDGRLAIGITNPSNILAVDKASALTGQHPKVYMVDTDSYREYLEKGYFFLENPIEARKQAIINELQASETTTGQTITALTDLIVMDAIRRNATDIHINPSMDITQIFYRIDGVLQYGHTLPKIAHTGIVSRIKILSSLDIAESRLPQDGSFSFEFFRKTFDIRVSTVPAIHGENVVLRVLAGSGVLHRLEKLGFDSAEVDKIRALFQKPYGIILVAGPTGSGKTTTLYAALREVDLLERNVLTVENPVEYKLSLVKQTQVNEKAGYEFALAARNFMRQDPDVILIGEIRDEETARIAVRSAITGHLVLSTIHTNDAVTSIPRLLDLKVDKFLMSTALLAIVAQRLARRICPFCKEMHEMNEAERNMFRDYEIPVEAISRGRGCAKCSNTGYAGRLAIGEILVVDDDIKDLIYGEAPITTLQATAIKKGMMSFKRDGLRKAAQGLTSLEEVLRVTG